MQIISRSETIDAMLAPFQAAIGQDFDGYRSHVLRVLTYALHFLGDDQTHRSVIEVALVFHDIGMWTDRDLAYLKPSVAQALAANDHNDWGHDPALLRAIIEQHHKVFAYRGRYADIVNAVRKADWVDATGGTLRKGLSRRQIAAVTAAIPVAGFADTLMRLASDLANGNRLKGLSRVVRRVYKW